MMMPSLSASLSLVSATIRVHKATSELLVGPDWSLNIEICDACNSNHWLTKDVMKEAKRRLQHKNPKVQLLTLTLLETIVKNCGDYMHRQIGERKILDEMIKIVKKKGDIHVRDKILVLLDSWQEAFGGPGGKHSQYYWACDELRRIGAHFPQRSQLSSSIVTPSVTHTAKVPQIGYGMPVNSSRRLDEAMTSEVESLSLSTLDSMQNVLELLNDMLRVVNPDDRMAVKDDVIIDLVDRCRGNQKKLMQMITTTTDEKLLALGLEMNDSLQTVLAKHDAIASGTPLPNHSRAKQSESVDSSLKIREASDKIPIPNGDTSTFGAPRAKGQGEEDEVEEEEEDEFALLAKRHSKDTSTPSQSTAMGSADDAASSSNSNSNALVLIDPAAPPPIPAPAASMKEQDLIDLLSVVLSPSSAPSETPQAPSSAPGETSSQDPFSSYVVPWAQAQTQPQHQQPFQPQPQFQAQSHLVQPQMMQPQSQQGYSPYSLSYPPPWEATSGYAMIQNFGSSPLMYQGIMNGSSGWPSQNFNSFQGSQYGSQQMYQSPQTSVNSSPPMQGIRPLQHSNSFHFPSSNGNVYSTTMQSSLSPSSMPMQSVRNLQYVNSFPAMSTNGLAMNGNMLMTSGSTGGSPSGQKPFVPSYQLFEDLNVFGSTEGKMKSSTYPSASGNSNQNMIAGRRELHLLD